MSVINRNSGSPIFNTLAEAQASNMEVGQLPIVLGTSGAFDGGGIIYSVQPNGSGGLSMSNGNELVKYTGTAAVLDVMTDLSDPTSGSLMPPGAFGLGSDAVRGNEDLDLIGATGFYDVDSSDTGKPGSVGGFLTHLENGTENGADQRFVDFDGAGVWSRAKNGGVWTSWKRLDPQAYGVGDSLGSFSDTDCNAGSYVISGIHGTSAVANTLTNAPPDATDTSRYLVHFIGNAATQARQIMVNRNSGAFWQRVWSGGAPSAWAQVYTQSSILGTVSQSGGVPTGAVIERGSNANGEYVKFADGTLIMAANVTASLTSGSVQTFPFPAAIIDGADSPFLSFGMGGNASERTQYRLTDGFLTTSLDDSWSVQLTSTGGATGGCTLRLLAVGRWF